MAYTFDITKLPTTPQEFDVSKETQELNERLLARAYAMVAEAERLINQQRQRIKVLESLSFTDELTGCLNRRGFEMAIARELTSAQRDPNGGGILIMIDLDSFKLVNDRLGHAAGDAYLQMVGKTLMNHVRAGDVVSRLGGDEFAIILARTRTAGGMRRAAQLQTILNSAALAWKDLALPLRASFGATPFGDPNETASDVLKRADARLYANKAARKGKRSA